MLWPIYIAPLPDTVNSEALRYCPCLMKSHGVTCYPLLFPQGQSHTWNIYIRITVQHNSHTVRCIVASHFTDPNGLRSLHLSSLRESRPGVEPGPLLSEASVLPLGHRLPQAKLVGYKNIRKRSGFRPAPIDIQIDVIA